MNDEWLDVVDDQDAVIGRASRKEVHDQGRKHRAVHILVFNRQGEVFLQKRSQRKDRHPGVWDSSASGHLDAGETYEAAAYRELKEELGCTPKQPLQRLFKLEASPATGEEFVWVYVTEAEGPFTLPPDEIETGRWFGPKELDQWLATALQDFAPSFPLIWKRWRQLQG